MSKRKPLLIGIGVILAGLMVFFFVLNGRLSDARMREGRNASRISDLTRKLEALKKEPAAPEGPSEVEQEEISYSAAALGNQVAELQNKYQTGDDGTIGDALDPCFGESDKNARTPWYFVPSAEDGIPGTWQFVTNGTFHGTSKHVIWLCKSASGELLAYATGVYHPDTNVFTDVSWEMSYLAANAVGSSGIPPATTEGNLDDLIHQMESVAPPVGDGSLSESEEQEISDIKDAQEWLREEMQDEANSAYVPEGSDANEN